MLDLETLGQAAGCVILSIGAIVFDAEAAEVHARSGWHLVVNRSSCESVGLTIDHRTRDWWHDQPVEAKCLLAETESYETSVSIHSALHSFTKWFGYQSEAFNIAQDDVRIWSYGSTFDIPILESAYKACLMQIPWNYRNALCFRTLRRIGPAVETKHKGIKHNALYDAINQANEAVAILRAMKESK